MKRASIFALALAVWLLQGPVAAETTTPLVPNDVGHWLNLEYRIGKLAPEIAGNRHLVQNILVVERSLAKLDAYLEDNRRVSGCHEMLLPYVKIVREPHSEIKSNGDILITYRKVRHDAWLPVAVCSFVDQRVVLWESNGALVILGRPRNDDGDFPRTVYALYQISLEERAKWTERTQRLAARGKVAKPPRVDVLYMPPGEKTRRTPDSPLGPFGDEFWLPQIAGSKLASGEPTVVEPAPGRSRPER